MSIKMPLCTAASVFLMALTLPAPVRANETLLTCGNGVNHIFAHAAALGINTSATCPGDPINGAGLAIQTAGNTVGQGQRATWQTSAPAGLMIVGASVYDMWSAGINDGDAYGGGFYWAGGESQAHDNESSVGVAPMWSSFFGWQVVCRVNSCKTSDNLLTVGDIALYVQETVGPNLVSPDGLWQSSGWVRGDWSLHFYGDSPSGLCWLGATINGETVASSYGQPQDTSVWHQCNAPAITQTIQTPQDEQGAIPLTLSTTDAAGLVASYTKKIYVDNSQPMVTLSGPSDAPSTAGVEYVTATAGGSPSGIAGIACAVDGRPDHWYPGAIAQVPVSGVAHHSVQCAAANNAVDQAGNHGWSTPATWSLNIREPTVSAISFDRVVNALRCVRVRKALRCRPRTKLESVTVWVPVRRHGKRVWIKRKERKRVVVPPQVVSVSTLRVPYGHQATVSGWVGTYGGVALGGQSVTVWTAPDSGQGSFAPAATVTTAANGGWTATLPSGPSRIVEAVFNGGSTTEPAMSPQVRMVVPAALQFRIEPRRTHWGGKIHMSGRLLGGYIPTPGETVFLHVAVRGLCCDIIHLTAGPRGRFGYTYTFVGGGGPYTYRFWAASVGEADYPYAANRSSVLTVTVG